MDSDQRSQKNQPFKLIAKSFALFFFFVISLLGLLTETGCVSNLSHVPKEIQSQLQSPSSPNLDVSSLGIQLTKMGSNDFPSLSTDGKKIAFLSRNRITHSQSQVYVFDLEKLIEKRVTYQDGECGSPLLIQDGKKIIYSSSTDELKERPLLFQTQQASPPWPPSDLYESDLAGTEIRRLTQRPGFDGLALSFENKKDSHLIYSQWNGHHLEAWQLNLKNKEQKPLLIKKDRSIVSLRLSPNGKQWVWIEKMDDGTSSLNLAPLSFDSKQKKTLLLGQNSAPDQFLKLENFNSVEWWDDQTIYFSAQFPKQPFQLYSYNLKDSCLKVQIEHPSNLTSPQLNPTKEGMVFVSDANGGKNIYYKSLSALAPCLPQ